MHSDLSNECCRDKQVMNGVISSFPCISQSIKGFTNSIFLSYYHVATRRAAADVGSSSRCDEKNQSAAAAGNGGRCFGIITYPVGEKT